MNEDKTKIVYAKLRGKKSTKWETSFDSLGYTFRDRVALDKESEETFTGFLPAISKSSQKRISVVIKGLCLKKLLHKSISNIANLMEDMIKGWIQYYTKFGKTEFNKVMYRLSMTITYWLRRKHKPLREKSIYATYRVLIYITSTIACLLLFWGVYWWTNYIFTEPFSYTSVWFAILDLSVLLGLGYLATLQPHYLEVSEQQVIIHRFLGKVVIYRNDILCVKRKKSMNKDVRTFGSGGLFGCLGYFYSFAEGKYFAYVRDVKTMVYIQTKGKNYVVSCDEPDEFIKMLDK